MPILPGTLLLLALAGDDALLGCYRGGADGKTIVRLEKDRVTRLVDGRLDAYPARYEEGTIVVSATGVRHRWSVEADANGAWLSMERGRERFLRLEKEKAPPELDPKPMKLGKPRKLKPAETKAIQDQLAKRETLDQAVRNDAARERETPKVDADNTAYLAKIVSDLGWIDAERFGERAATAAWLLATHSGDLPLMLAALPEIEKDVAAKRLRDGQNYANLFDRVRVTLGSRQRFGTQVGQDERGEFVVLLLEDETKVDAWRKAIRMVPLAEDLEKQKAWTGGKAIGIQKDI